jgi:hypothetical protein
MISYPQETKNVETPKSILEQTSKMRPADESIIKKEWDDPDQSIEDIRAIEAEKRLLRRNHETL